MSLNRSTDQEAAQNAWRALAPLIAGQPRVRLSKDGGKSYPTAGERQLRDKLPAVPAAVKLCGSDGTVATIALDFDVRNGNTAHVDDDAAAVQRWLRSHGAIWIEDCSPAGGRHIYVPLKKRVAFTEARHFVEALALRHTSIDPGPHRSADVGCIRPPGSLHKRGGHQTLTMPLNQAYTAAISRNCLSVWMELGESLKEEIATVTQRRTTPLELLTDAEYLPLSGGPRNLPIEKNRLARTGLYDTETYNSPSEARQAVLASAAAAGWQITDVQRLIHSNTWAGMASFYSRYSSQHRSAALRRDWIKAVRYIAQFREKQSVREPMNETVHKSYTSRINTQGALHSPASVGSSDEYHFLKGWNLVREQYELGLIGTREGLTLRLLLRALGEAANKVGSRYVEFGVRSLALAVGIHHTTVARMLRGLTSSNNSPLRLVLEARGTRGDLYELVVPPGLIRKFETRKWRRGPVHALRPVFRALGVTSAFTYEALEISDSPLTTAEIIQSSGLSPAATAQALEVLAAWNLIEKSGSQWVIVKSTNLKTVAEYLGVLDEVCVQLARYRVERLQWRIWLEVCESRRQPVLLAPDEPYPFWDRDGPADAEYTLTDFIMGQAMGQTA